MNDPWRQPELFTRCPANPLLTADQWPYPANAVFNPAATVIDGEHLLLCRVEDRQGISHLTVARSRDGISDWRISDEPLIATDPDDRASRWGVEDPRITRVDEMDAWLIAYTVYGPGGPGVALAVTRDFDKADKIGVIMPPEDKNAALLPRHIDGRFVLLHRPTSHQAARADVWLSRSVDLRSWSAPEPVMHARPHIYWDSARIGMGPPPLETPHGWLGVYHGVKNTAAGPIYRMGLVLLDLENPAVVRHRTDDWVLAPRADYERIGDIPNVVFPTGMIHDPRTDELRIYYGAADSTVAMASAPLTEVLATVMSPDRILRPTFAT